MIFAQPAPIERAGPGRVRGAAADRRRGGRGRRLVDPDGRDRQARRRRSADGRCWRARSRRSPQRRSVDADRRRGRPERVGVAPAAALAAGGVAAVVPGRRPTPGVGGGRAGVPRPTSGRGDDDRVVLVHDGARPSSRRRWSSGWRPQRPRHGAAIPVLPIAETVKRIDGETVVGTVDRTDLATAQTPQGFRRGVLRAAYARHDPAGPDEWTDEAALCESCTIAVHVVPGDPTNLKVTVPADLVRAEAYLGGGGPAEDRPRPRQPPVRARSAARAGRHRDRRTRRASTVTPTATSRSMPSPMPCSARPASAISDGSSRPVRRRHAASPAASCSARCWRGVAAAGCRPGRCRPRWSSGPGRGWALISTRCATPIAASARPARRRRQRQGVERQPVGRRGRRTRDVGPGRRHRGAAAMTLAPARHPLRRGPAPRAARTGPRRRLQLRSDGVRPGPHRQLPVVPVRRRARPPPAPPRPAGDLGDEHHRHRRQDHPGRGRRGHLDRPSSPTAGRRGSSSDAARAADDDARRAAPGDGRTSTRSWP